MPANLVLLLCVCLVVYLLRVERKIAPELSTGLWVPTVWMLYCASRPVSYWLHPHQLIDGVEDVSEGNSTERLLLGALLLLSIVILMRRRVRWSEVFRDNSWLFVVFAFMFVSMLWSDYPFVSFKRWIRSFGSVPMAMVVLTEKSPRDAFASVMRRTAYILIPFSLVLIKYFPDMGVAFHRYTGERMWVGVCTQKNGLGRLCLISAFFLIWDFIRRKRAKDPFPTKYNLYADFVVLGLTFWIMRGPGGGAYSATAIAVLVLGIGCYLGVLKLKNRLARLEVYFMVGLVLYLIANLVAQFVAGHSLFEVVLVMLERDPTLTGRTEIWDELRQYVWHSPILGCGYGSFWVNPPISIRLNEAHNGYLDVMLEVGGLGMVFLILFMLAFYRQIRNTLQTDLDWAAFALSFLIMSVVYNLTESAFLKPTSHLWAMLVYLAIVFRAGTIPARQSPQPESVRSVQSPDGWALGLQSGTGL